jgi:hypothetical protein
LQQTGGGRCHISPLVRSRMQVPLSLIILGVFALAAGIASIVVLAKR